MTKYQGYISHVGK